MFARPPGSQRHRRLVAIGFAAISDGVGHPHHSEDHSHDRVHALPAGLALSLPDLSRWQAATGRWTALLTVYRLERPPMA